MKPVWGRRARVGCDMREEALRQLIGFVIGNRAENSHFWLNPIITQPKSMSHKGSCLRALRRYLRKPVQTFDGLKILRSPVRSRLCPIGYGD